VPPPGTFHSSDFCFAEDIYSGCVSERIGQQASKQSAAFALGLLGSIPFASGGGVKDYVWNLNPITL